MEYFISLWVISGLLFWLKIVYQEWSEGNDLDLSIFIVGPICGIVLGLLIWVVWFLIEFSGWAWPVIVKGKKK